MKSIDLAAQLRNLGLNKYLVDVRQQFQGHEHLGMVDGVLETLMHRHPVNRVKPSELKVRQTEPSD